MTNRLTAIRTSIQQLEDSSAVFLDAWQRNPPELDQASDASMEAMVHLDHIVNDILRARDDAKTIGNFKGSDLAQELRKFCGLASSSVTRAQQEALVTVGPGNGSLPFKGQPLKMERLLNKIKHRISDLSNFRVGNKGEHIFVISVNKPNHQPDSIVEFIIGDFCSHCSRISAILERY
ncbi:hypothetical protein DXZ20_00585 [Leptolyngbyaceae cyanobacterium CCMR0081]|uniref:Uncharacterized protein n=1 Tax=Adonisia turfae CCMR0081 TaxID=2292702 RepID=A0A6M0RDC4_9CYAN|nr:hypothetical protein [Adonisia turfae CCMR0081]